MNSKGSAGSKILKAATLISFTTERDCLQQLMIDYPKHLYITLVFIRLSSFFLLLLLTITIGFAQDSTTLAAYENHLLNANKYDNVSLFAECIEEIDAAIQITKEQGWVEKEAFSSIFLVT